MKNVPSFKNKNGKSIYKESHVTALTNAVYADKSKIEVETTTYHIIESNRNDSEWVVIVEED